MICISCSRTFGIVIDNTAEWNFMVPRILKEMILTDVVTSNSLLPEFSLGSVIPFKHNESLNEKIRNYNTWIGSCYREKVYTMYSKV